MADKAPRELWLQTPIDTPEKFWKGGDVSWCWHPVNENDDDEPDTKYLRADTCTPNEECVSKAELEVFIRELEGLANPDTSSDGMDLAWGATTNLSLVKRDARATAYGIVAKRLREVMDK